MFKIINFLLLTDDGVPQDREDNACDFAPDGDKAPDHRRIADHRIDKEDEVKFFSSPSKFPPCASSALEDQKQVALPHIIFVHWLKSKLDKDVYDEQIEDEFEGLSNPVSPCGKFDTERNEVARISNIVRADGK